MASSRQNRLVFDARKLKMTDVTIYGDRAEIKRALTSELAKGGFENGMVEIVVTELPRSIDNGSIRVEGSGIGTIADVKYEEKKKELDGKEKDMSRNQEERRKLLDEKQTTVKELREMLRGAAKSLAGNQTADVDDMKTFEDYYTERQEQLAQRSIEIEREINAFERQVKDDRAKNPMESDEKVSRQVSILVADVKEAGRLNLVIAYFVSNASWKPTYDIRVVDKKLSLIYYGMIKQNSGENWDNAQVTLSTAEPNVGGKEPVIEREKIGLKQRRPIYRSFDEDAPAYHSFSPELMLTGNLRFEESPRPQIKADTMKNRWINLYLVNQPITTEENPRSNSEILLKHGILLGAHFTLTDIIFFLLFSTRAPVLEHPIARAIQISVCESPEFTTTTIPSDNAEHRLVIGQIELNPTFKHRSIPCKESSAYLTARVVNTSEYHLLAGPTSIYLGNSFVRKGDLESVGPRGEFRCSLGIDSNIKIVYKSLADQVEQGGILSSKSVLKRERKIVVKNLNKQPIQITVIDRYPQAINDKVKVPEESVEGTPSDTFTKNNGRVDWKLQLQPDEERVLSFKYKVDYPKGTEIETHIDHEDVMVDG